MTYGPADVRRDLALVRDGAASFEVRARLEHFLLDLVKGRGTEALGEFLQSLPDYHFSPDAAAPSSQARFVSDDRDTRRLVVGAYAGPELTWVNVTVEDSSTSLEEPDPRHQAFYALWEDLLGLPDSAVADLDAARKAVFLVGLLEAEVMNGGFGQYLTNTDGVHVDDTVRCLAQIKADTTRTLLTEAVALASDADSYVAAWESKSSEFTRLDDQFLESGEDLAGLTADAFLDLDSGGSV